MIIGIGTDICDIRRIELTLARFGDRFIHRVFALAEQQRASRRPLLLPEEAKGSMRRNSRAATYAKRFAAKEACAKALGTGFSGGVFMRDIAVVNEPSGKPTIVLSGGARARFDRLIPAGLRGEIAVTLTDDYPLAQAIVMISAVSLVN